MTDHEQLTGSTTAGPTWKSMKEMIESIPKPDPKGTPVIRVHSVEDFKQWLDEKRADRFNRLCEHPPMLGGIQIREYPFLPESVVAYVVWHYGNENEPHLIQKIMREDASPND